MRGDWRGFRSVSNVVLGSGVHPGAATHGIHRGLSICLGQSCQSRHADSAQSRKVIGAPRSAFLVSVSMTSLASPSVANCAACGDVPSPASNHLQPLDVRSLTLRWLVKSRSTLFGNVSCGYPYSTTLRHCSVGSTSTRPGPGPPRQRRRGSPAPHDRRCSLLVLGGDCGPARGGSARSLDGALLVLCPPFPRPPVGALQLGDSTGSTSPRRRSRPAPRPGRVAASTGRTSRPSPGDWSVTHRPAVYRGVRLVRRVPARGFALSRSSLGRRPSNPGHSWRVRRRRGGPGPGSRARTRPPPSCAEASPSESAGAEAAAVPARALVPAGAARCRRSRPRTGEGIGRRRRRRRRRRSFGAPSRWDRPSSSSLRRGRIPRRARDASPPAALLAPLELRHLRGLHDVRDDA